VVSRKPALSEAEEDLLLSVRAPLSELQLRPM